MSLGVEPRHLGGRKLVDDYLRGDPQIGAFFNGSPHAAASYRHKLAEVQKRFGGEERRRAADALRPTSAAAEERLRRFVADGGAVVTTGQQAGLFTGPLYSIYKILSTVELARTLEGQLGIIVLPVFWTASEDHDWEEVNHTFVAGERGSVHRIEVQSDERRPLPMSERRLGRGVESALDALVQASGYKEVDGQWVELLRGCYSPGETVAAAFRTTIEHLFASFDLLTTDAADPALKRASVPILLREAHASREHERALAERTEELLGAGYHAQVSLLPGATNLFYHGANGRERLYRTRDGWATRESRHSFATGELERRIQQDPVCFSPNVFLRPVVESSVFPVLAYVAGPGEISYFAQIGGLFRSASIEPPVVYPRFSCTLVEARIGRALDDLGMRMSDLAAPVHELRQRIARDAVPPTVRESLGELRRTVTAGYEELMREAADIDPTLSGPLGANRNAALAGVGRSEHKILRQLKANSAVQLEKLDRVRAHLVPGGQPQERVLNIFPYLFRHGDTVLDELASAMRSANAELPRAFPPAEPNHT